MVLLGVENEDELDYWKGECYIMDIPHHIFHEPDVNGFTAMVVHPSVDSEMFRGLRLL
jgi:hypothetical protein